MKRFRLLGVAAAILGRGRRRGSKAEHPWGRRRRKNAQGSLQKDSKALAQAREEDKLSSIIGKAWLPALAILAVFAMFAIGGQARSAEADIDSSSYIVDPSNDELCDDDARL